MGSGDPADPLAGAISDDMSAPDVQDGSLPNGV
jgi:hypothetical protein